MELKPLETRPANERKVCTMCSKGRAEVIAWSPIVGRRNVCWFCVGAMAGADYAHFDSAMRRFGGSAVMDNARQFVEPKALYLSAHVLADDWEQMGLPTSLVLYEKFCLLFGAGSRDDLTIPEEYSPADAQVVVIKFLQMLQRGGEAMGWSPRDDCSDFQKFVHTLNLQGFDGLW